MDEYYQRNGTNGRKIFYIAIKPTESNEIRTDKTTDKGAQIDLKPEVAEKGSQSEVISKDGEVQTEESSEFTDESCFDTIVNDEFIDEDYDSMEEVSI